ncbi:MAG: hypothetical protein ABJH98_07825 [Reichenbachiella sp.]|uniref:hypothetical protein n=1 Tax=Reichenbachiella sp. TaxID=2184521 RepID=UPI003297CEA2
MNASKFIKKPRQYKKRGFSAGAQLKMILKSFPNVKVLRYKGSSFSIITELTPTTLSKEYQIKIDFDKYDGVKVYVIGEVLKVAKNRSKLPHVYSHSEQRLCLYSPSKEEWNREKLIVSTIIPWTSDWLFYYELWIPNGVWFGGGHDEYREN